MLLKDKVVIISGIGPGLGQELAYGASENGAKCVLAARTQEKLDQVKEEIEKGGNEAICVPTDITNPDDCKKLLNMTLDKFGKVLQGPEKLYHLITDTGFFITNGIKIRDYNSAIENILDVRDKLYKLS